METTAGDKVIMRTLVESSTGAKNPGIREETMVYIASLLVYKALLSRHNKALLSRHTKALLSRHTNGCTSQVCLSCPVFFQFNCSVMPKLSVKNNNPASPCFCSELSTGQIHIVVACKCGLQHA